MSAIATDDRTANIDEVDRTILDFSKKLTRTPAEMTAADVEALRRVGLSDGAIHDVVQVAALFAYYNRLADGLGIDDEPEWTPR